MDALHQSRMLLVGTDPDWVRVAAEVAVRRNAALDVQADVRGAMASMMASAPGYDHVLAVAPLRAKSVDALAGMLNEASLDHPNLVMLGCTSSGTSAQVDCVLDASADALALALDRSRLPRDLPPMQAAELVSTLHAGGLRMQFQPILRASDLAPIGLESLARLHHTRRGILHPRDFIPLTVACGRERVLTGIVAARTFLEIGATMRKTGLFVTLNLPLSTVMHEYAVARGLELCSVCDVLPENIMIEVLETRHAPDLGHLRDALLAWRKAGFRTAIDDAGPALPHWRALLDLPFDTLKLDGAMVSDPDQHGLLEAIVGEARMRGRTIVAEGVEDQACLDRVLSLGVDALQGFLFSRPLPALAVPLWLKHWQARN